MIAALVLAAGASRRMGTENKLLLSWRGQPLVTSVVRTLVGSRAQEVIVVLGHEADRVRAVLPGLGERVVENPDWSKGMTTTIQRGARTATEQASGLMVCLCDQPLMEVKDYDFLIEHFEEKRRVDPRCIIVPTFAERRGNPVLFSAAFKPQILAHSQVHGCRDILADSRQHVHEVAMPNDHIHRDIDTQEAYLGLLNPLGH